MRIVPVCLIAVLALSGCSALPNTATAETAEAVTLTNCGTAVTFATPPERVITIKSTSTEMLLALGLEDRIVGTAFQDGPVSAEWAAAAASIPSIADMVPSEEVVLEAEPDLVYAGWESNFSADGAGERAELASLGIATYVSPAACQGENAPGKLAFDDVFADIEQVASIFGVDASALVTSQRQTLDAIEKVGADRSAFWYSSGADTPYAGAGLGAPAMVMDAVGLTNIASDVEATWAPLSWEAVVDADPYFIVLVDATWNTVETKIGLLESNPATANLDAVREKRYLIVPFAAAEAGVRSVEAAASIAEQVTEFDAR